MCALTGCPFAFPTRSKRVSLDVLRLLFQMLDQESKTVRIVRIDEDSALARSREFCKFIQQQNMSLQTTRGYMSSFNGLVERPHRDAQKSTRIALGSNSALP